MPRLLPITALVALSLAVSTAAVPVQPAWTLRDVAFLGFTDGGEVLTQPHSSGSGPAPRLERRDPGTGELLGEVVFPEAGDDLGLLAFTPDLTTFAWLNRAGDVLTVRTGMGRWTASIPGLSGTWSLTLSPDGRTLAALNVNGYVQLWDVLGGRRRATLMLHSQPRGLAFHPTQPLLAVNESRSGEGSVTLWNTATGEKVLTVPGLTGTLRPFGFAPDGSLLTRTGYSVGFFQLGLGRISQGDWGLSVRSLPTYTEPCPKGIQARVCARGVWKASFDAGGNRVLLDISRTPQNVSSALLCDTKSGALLKVIDTPNASATLSPDGRTLILKTWTGDLQGAPIP